MTVLCVVDSQIPFDPLIFCSHTQRSLLWSDSSSFGCHRWVPLRESDCSSMLSIVLYWSHSTPDRLPIQLANMLSTYQLNPVNDPYRVECWGSPQTDSFCSFDFVDRHYWLCSLEIDIIVWTDTYNNNWITKRPIFLSPIFEWKSQNQIYLKYLALKPSLISLINIFVVINRHIFTDLSYWPTHGLTANKLVYRVIMFCPELKLHYYCNVKHLLPVLQSFYSFWPTIWVALTPKAGKTSHEMSRAKNI